MPIQRIKKTFISILKSGTSPHQLALTFAIGLYIALSPFPGAHTLIVLAAYRLFSLNFPLLFIAANINNPWTMIPLYGLDYSFGYWLIHSVLGLTPVWHFDYQSWFNYVHITLPFSGNFCITSFLVGGNILGIVAGLTSYPIVKFIAIKLRKTH